MGETSAVYKEREGSERWSKRRSLLEEGPWGGGRARVAGRGAHVGRQVNRGRKRLASGLQLLQLWPCEMGQSYGFGKKHEVTAMFMIAKKGSKQQALLLTNLGPGSRAGPSDSSQALCPTTKSLIPPSGRCSQTLVQD